MKKYLFLVLFAFILVSCDKTNPIVGSWVKSESKEVFTGADMGMVSVMTFNSDGTLEEKHEIQTGVKGEDFGIGLTLLGKWEMPTKEKLIVHMEKAVIDGEERDNKKDVEYTIVTVDEQTLVMMSGGKESKYRRK